MCVTEAEKTFAEAAQMSQKTRKKQEKSKKKAKEISSTDGRRCSKIQNVFICVHLCPSVDKMFVIFCKCRLKDVVI